MDYVQSAYLVAAISLSKVSGVQVSAIRKRAEEVLSAMDATTRHQCIADIEEDYCDL